VKEAKDKKRTLRKNHVLKFIRDQQEKNMNQLFEKESTKKTPNQDSEAFNSDFKESLNYLMSLSEDKEKNKDTLKNNTLKKYPSLPTFSDINQPFSNLIDSFVPNVAVPVTLSKPNLSIVPKFGCLKGGTLPTYRSYHNISQKRHPSQIAESSSEITKDQPKQESDFLKEDYKKSEIRQTLEKMKEKPKKMRHPKQKRTIRRTFKVGKSKTQPKISVLISNKTLRNQVSTQTHLLKQTPIDEVRRYLTKKGFIRVGSDAPNDVLRKMYESASLICGEIQNHNPDNLLYNFLNDVHP
jgi:hypothetical protein